MQACFINFKITFHKIYGKNNEIIKKGVAQIVQISKLETIFKTFPNQLEFGGEQLFWETTRGVLFINYMYL